LASELVQDAAESVLDGFGFGEGTADGVLNEKPAVEFVALVYRRDRLDSGEDNDMAECVPCR
jgi:hypothetical protein